MNKFLIVDGFGIIFKSYYAFIHRPLINKDGKNTSAVFGFFKSMVSLLKKENPKYFVVALEGRGECFRNKIYPDYKANRPPAPEDLVYQIPRIIEILDKLKIPHIELESFEADDIIGTITAQIEHDSDKEALILSSDKDLMQLVKKNVQMYKPAKNSNEFLSLNEEEVLKEFGVKPSQIVDYLAIIGDASDNIPGVKGIGPKGAISLLTDFESLENIYENIEKISPKLKDKLIKDKESAFLSQRLATIDKEVPISIDWNSLEVKPLDIDACRSILLDDSLTSIVKDIEEYNKNYFGIKTETKQIEEVKKESASNFKICCDYKLIKNKNEFQEIIESVKKYGRFCFDLETTGFDFFNDQIICLSIASHNKTFVVPVNISEFQQKESGIIIDADYLENLKIFLKEIFEDEALTKIGQNLKFDIKFLKGFGVEANGDLFDTMIAEYCLDASHNILGVKDLSEKYLDYKMIRYEEVVGDTKKNTLKDVPISNLVTYSGQDAAVTYKLFEYFREKLRTNKKIEELFYFIEMPLLKVLIDMEYNGVWVDKEYLSDLSKKLEKDLILINEKLQMYSEDGFNPNSPKQVGDILFNKLKLPIIKKTKTGPSTDVDVLKKLSFVHPFPQILLEHRSLSKIKSTYSDTLPLMINSKSKKIHTTYGQTGTQTGRISSKDPNLQNIPIKSDLGREIRAAFIPSKDNLILSADYSQIELYLLAEFSKDENLVSAFNNNEDIHSKTASLLFDKHIDEVTKQERTIAKTVNFGVLYGQGAYALSEDLGISRKEASEFINRYFEKYSGVAVFVQESKDKCRKNGYAETFWGRIRTIPEINDKNKMRQADGERMAVNTVIQGSAADLIKIAMIRIQNKFKEKELKTKLMMQVHDELIFDLDKNEKDLVISIVKDCMENGYGFHIKFKTTVEIGKNWGELH